MNSENEKVYKLFLWFYMHNYRLPILKKHRLRVDDTRHAYKKWAKDELKQAIMKMNFKNIAVIDGLECYLTQLNDYCEIFRMSHSAKDANPYDVLIDLTSAFLDFIYDNEAMLC